MLALCVLCLPWITEWNSFFSPQIPYFVILLHLWVDFLGFFIIPYVASSTVWPMFLTGLACRSSWVPLCWMTTLVCFIIKDNLSLCQRSVCCVTCSWSGSVAETLIMLLYEAVRCPEQGPQHRIIRFSSRQDCKSISSMHSISNRSQGCVV